MSDIKIGDMYYSCYKSHAKPMIFEIVEESMFQDTDWEVVFIRTAYPVGTTYGEEYIKSCKKLTDEEMLQMRLES